MHLHHPPRRRDYTEPRRWQPLSGTERGALLPFVLVRDRPGRPLRDARAGVDAAFRVAAAATAAAGSAWRALPPRSGEPDTASRHSRRLSDAGPRERPLRAPARPDAPATLRAPEHRVCRARGLRVIALARRLDFLSVLRAPSWLLPGPDLSELFFRRLDPALRRAYEHGLRTVPPAFLRACRYMLGAAAGRRRTPRRLQPF